LAQGSLYLWHLLKYENKHEYPSLAASIERLRERHDFALCHLYRLHNHLTTTGDFRKPCSAWSCFVQSMRRPRTHCLPRRRDRILSRLGHHRLMTAAKSLLDNIVGDFDAAAMYLTSSRM
jgi:hypothetical protein